MITAKQAVDFAKRYVLDLFEDEGISDLGLEEVDYDATARQWHVTLGFSRPWDARPDGGFAAALGKVPPRPRTYKVLVLDDASTPLSIRNREGVGVG